VKEKRELWLARCRVKREAGVAIILLARDSAARGSRLEKRRRGGVNGRRR